MNYAKNFLKFLKTFSLFSSSYYFHLVSIPSKYLNFLQAILKSCNSSSSNELVITIGNVVCIVDTKFDTILICLLVSSFSVTPILSTILLVSILFKERAIVLACCNFAPLVAFNYSRRLFF